MTTFTQLIDSVASELRRRDMVTTLVSYANQTIRELHAQPGQLGMSLQYAANLHELMLTPGVEDGYTWTIPEARNFQSMEFVWYPNRGVSPKERSPGIAYEFRNEVNGQYFFYRTGDAYAFSGYGSADSQIFLAYYSFPRRLTHFKLGTAPVTWNEETQEYTFASGIVTPEDQEAALLKSTNWMLERWPDLIMEGLRAKAFKRIGDMERARLSYSLYESGRPQLISAESYQYVPRVNR